MTVYTYLDDIAGYLQDNGIGTPGSDIFVSGLHDTDGNMILITPYPGADPVNIVSGERNLYQPNIQILVRNNANQQAFSKAAAIYELLRDVYNQEIGSTFFLKIHPYCPPAFLFRTNGGYYQYYINCVILFR